MPQPQGAATMGAAGGSGTRRNLDKQPERASVATAASTPQSTPTPSRRQLFALAAVLAATSLTGAAAIAGLTRSVPAAPAVPHVGQTITPAAPAISAPRRVEPGD